MRPSAQELRKHPWLTKALEDAQGASTCTELRTQEAESPAELLAITSGPAEPAHQRPVERGFGSARPAPGWTVQDTAASGETAPPRHGMGERIYLARRRGVGPRLRSLQAFIILASESGRPSRCSFLIQQEQTTAIECSAWERHKIRAPASPRRTNGDTTRRVYDIECD